MDRTTPVPSAKCALQHSTSAPSSTNSKKQKSPPTNIHYPCGDEMKEARDAFTFFLTSFIATNPTDFWYNLTNVMEKSLCELMKVEDTLMLSILLTCNLIRCRFGSNLAS
mmetsp:Transcript_56850/g.66464  ORF Transcript_56850/g.66464 Transcript_56850/m.66464 type:complete len:110 (-) Transcript_56850:371-700(-)